VNEHGGIRPAARALGVHNCVIHQCIQRVKANAALRGYSPEHDMVHPVPDTHIAKGVSTYYDKDGKPRGQWVKSSLDQQKLVEAVKAAVEELCKDVKRAKAIPAPKRTVEHLANLYTFTDSHVGMLSWGEETGADWGLKIAEATLVGAFDHLVDASPPARVAIVNQQGDWMHFDGLSAVTPQHGNLLDADGRFSKVVAVAVRILRRIIDKALAKHEFVHVICAEGNHDLASSVWLRHLFGLLYENEPRVQVNMTELPYYVIEHGKTMLCFHHGHQAKNESLPLLFAATHAEAWGRTSKRYIHVGHRHHVDEKEHPGVKVIQHSTIAARDAYAARGGWVSEREITAITYSDRFGQVARNTVTPEMLG
jgi:hypothetical protein